MKKLLCILCLSIMLINILIPSFAYAENDNIAQSQKIISETVETLEDGSQIITTIIMDNSSIARASTISGSKTKTGKNSDGDVIWTFTVKGTFSVNSGVSATCTSATCSNTTPGSGWSHKSSSVKKTSNKAVGSATFVKKVLGVTVDTDNISNTLTCDVNGNVY